jgi:hypothetical protein
LLQLFNGIKPLLGIRQSQALLSIQVTCNFLGIPAHDSSSFHRTLERGRDDPDKNWGRQFHFGVSASVLREHQQGRERELAGTNESWLEEMECHGSLQNM